ncbi:metalloprotease [Coemansia sp. RSA 1365]|nr:metalloprotease [Coemansia sp. RSA 1365]
MNPLDAKQLPDWKTGFESKLTVESRMPYEEYAKPLEQPINDNCQYRLLRLPNNMVVICINDSGSEIAKASLVVGAGMHADPSDALGLSHLLMYVFQELINKPNDRGVNSFALGNREALSVSIDECETSYSFYIKNKELNRALGDMSSVFINPHFDATTIDQQVDIVNSMFKRYLEDEEWRLCALISCVSNQEHPFSKLAIGDCKALYDSDPEGLRKKLAEFYNRFYSADNIKLVVSGNYSLDELTEMAVDYDFGQVDKEIACLQKITKQDLINMWDMYVNHDTAPHYARTDIHIWPNNAQIPSTTELEKYPATVLALQRLIKIESDYDINLEELFSFIKSECTNDNQNNAYENLVALYPVLKDLQAKVVSYNNNKNSNDTDILTQGIKVGLQMALENAVKPLDYHKCCFVDFANIGMFQTREGIWIIDDISKFQSTQMLNGSLIPATKLIPKYEN